MKKAPVLPHVKKTIVRKKVAPKRFHIISLFPETMQGYLNDSIVGRAQEKKLIKIDYQNPRAFTKDKFARVDQRPYGGGPGMVLQAEPFLKAIAKAKGKRVAKTKVIFFAPEGTQFTNAIARDWVKKYDEFIFISGRYEGIDARVKRILRPEVVTVGPYVLTGGELPAMICIDAMTRQIPGVLGDFASLEEERTASPDAYTRPDVLVWKQKKYKVPEVLKTGNHRLIEEWRKEQLAKQEKSMEKNKK
ncbi:MAG TPA: tRNA (guanosine(37)-N1)-methyltransferase TrmD [Candidatus Paceibacterota bacterium]|nr:tRNA (guanosine(37)-N1)-methyltransferase TrmD [Candidatus Paceibacterota bacterium]